MIQNPKILARAHYNNAYDVLAVGVSTGGPTALKNLLSRLPAAIPICVLVVQHMMDGFIPHMVTWLSKHCQLKIKIAEQGEFLRSGTVYVAPSGVHLSVNKRWQIRLDKEPYEMRHRPSIDVMMKSVAQVFGRRSLGLILTGVGTDGVEGVGAIKRAGGVTIAQGAQSSEIFDMPKRAIEQRHIDDVVEMQQLPKHLIDIV